jgi:hypothetical protein
MKWDKPPAFTAGAPTLSREFYIVSDCGRWQICKTGNPPVYSLAKLGGKYAELVCSGTIQECKDRARTESV